MKDNHDKSLTKLIMAGVGLSGTILTGASVSGLNSKNAFSPAKKTENSGIQSNIITINDIKNDIQAKKIEETEKIQIEKNDFFSNINNFVEFKEKITEELGYFVSENFNSEINQEEMTLDKLLGRNVEHTQTKEIVEDNIIESDDEYVFEFNQDDILENSISSTNENKEKVYELNRFFGFKEMNPHTRW